MTRGRPKKRTIEDIFKVVAKHDFNIKSASQELKLTKKSIQNYRSIHKERWQELLQAHGKEQAALKGEPRYTGVKKVADHKIDRSKRGVRSEMANKHVNVTRSINGESLKEENVRLVKQNEELGKALERANKENTAIAEEHNSLIDDYDRAKNDLEDYRKALKAREEEKKHLQERLEKSQDLSKHYQDVIKEIQHNHSKLGETELLDDYHVKLGKVYVDDQQMISKEIFEMDIEKAKAVADFSGGEIYQSALVPYKEGESDV